MQPFENLWGRLFEFLNTWADATEVAPGRIEVAYEDSGGAARTITIVMTPDQWDDMASVGWGSFDDAAQHLSGLIRSMRGRDRFLVYTQYSVEPSETEEHPANEEVEDLVPSGQYETTMASLLSAGRDPFAPLRGAGAPPLPRFSPLLHLQAAACARPSPATLQAEIDHLRLEHEQGGYVAEALAEETLDGLRAGLGELLGTDADGVALVDSATSALTALLAAWPLPDSGRVGLVPSEWGPNVVAFGHRGLDPVWLEVDGHGRLDVDALDLRLREDPPDLVHLTRVAAHRGLVQPVAAALEVCRQHGVPLWVDAAQAAGHVDCAHGVDATYAPGRKWLRGPRGVGFVAVAERHRAALRGGVPALKPDDAHVAGRVGLAVAVRELLDAGPLSVFHRLAETGAALRGAVADVPGWTCADVPGTAAAIVSLRPTAGADVAATQRRLYDDHGILATASEPWRAPHEMTEPLLRFAPHLDVTAADAERLFDALTAV